MKASCVLRDDEQDRGLLLSDGGDPVRDARIEVSAVAQAQRLGSPRQLQRNLPLEDVEDFLAMVVGQGAVANGLVRGIVQERDHPVLRQGS